LSSARLVAGSGDVATSWDFGYDFSSNQARAIGAPSDFTFACVNTGNTQAAGSAPDGVPDWAVGELRSTYRPGLGAEALALATTMRPWLAPQTVDLSPAPSDVTSASYRPTDAGRLQAYLQSEYLLLPSYSLNAVDVIDPTGTGWAVGDHGAIVHLGPDKSAASGGRVAPPGLGAHEPASAPEQSAYEPFRPVAGAAQAGIVPALAQRPLERLAKPAMVPMGSPNLTLAHDEEPHAISLPREDVGQIVMNRDASEGWAIGPGADVLQKDRYSFSLHLSLTLQHFTGGQWSRCDQVGVPGLVAADPACASLAPLRFAGPHGTPVLISAAAHQL
jgi:hypothetical protein